MVAGRRVVRLLLDTEALLVIDAKGLDGLGKESRLLVADPDNDLLLSSVSITEIAIKASIGKLQVTANIVTEIANDLQLTIINYEPRHANRLFSLPLHHRDPFDRMLIATALLEQYPLVSSDSEFRKYDGLKVIW